MSILDEINKLKTQGPKRKPTRTAKPSSPEMKKRIKEVVEGRKKAPTELQKEAQEAQALVHRIKPQIEGVEITSQEEYAFFDSCLGEVTGARKDWKIRVEKILVPLRAATNAVHELNRATDRPRESLELYIKGKMADWQRKLDAKKEADDSIKLLEAQKLRDEAAKLEQKASVVTTPGVGAGRIHIKAADDLARASNLRAIAADIEEIETTVQADAEHSHAKRPMVWEITDMAELIKAVAAGDIPADVLEVNHKVINRYFKSDQEGVKEWPGVRVYEDIRIVSGGRWQGE